MAPKEYTYTIEFLLIQNETHTEERLINGLQKLQN